MTRTGIVRELNNMKNSGLLSSNHDDSSVRIYYFFANAYDCCKIARIYIYKTDPICFRITFNIPEKNYFHAIDVRYSDFKSMSDFRIWLGSVMQKYLFQKYLDN